jgi:putative transposase
MEALRSADPPRLPKLTDVQFAALESELARGPVAHGWADQRWTLERVGTVIARTCHVSCSIAGLATGAPSRLVRPGPPRRALELDLDAVWKKDVWPHVEAPRRRSDACKKQGYRSPGTTQHHPEKVGNRKL